MAHDKSDGQALEMAKSKPRKQHRRSFIRDWRQHRGFTQEKLAELVEMTPSAISMLERGQSGIRQTTLEKLAKALQTDWGSLLNRRPEDDGVFLTIYQSLSATAQQITIDTMKTLKRTGV